MPSAVEVASHLQKLRRQKVPSSVSLLTREPSSPSRTSCSRKSLPVWGKALGAAYKNGKRLAETPHLSRKSQGERLCAELQLTHQGNLLTPLASSTLGTLKRKQVVGSSNFRQIQNLQSSTKQKGAANEKMPDIPFVLNLDSPDSIYYGHDMFPNRMYRRLHSRQHHDLDLHTLGLIARMGAHAHHLVAKKHSGELGALGVGGPVNKQGNFEVHLDVGLFEPGEISVKLINDCIVVEGKHEEREDEHGHVSRHFVRRYPLAKEFDADAITSTLSEDGALTITVPPLKPKEEPKERVIPIKHVGGPSDLFQNGNGNGNAKKEAAAPDSEAK